MFRDARQKAGLTQIELSRKLGVDVQFISNMEREVAPIPPRLFKRLSEALSVPVKRFFDHNVERYKNRMKKEISESK